MALRSLRSDVASSVTATRPLPAAPPRPPRAPADLLLLRRLQQDDGWGVGEALNETGLTAAGAGIVTRGTHRVWLGSLSSSGAARRALMQARMGLVGPWAAVPPPPPSHPRPRRKCSSPPSLASPRSARRRPPSGLRLTRPASRVSLSPPLHRRLQGPHFSFASAARRPLSTAAGQRAPPHSARGAGAGGHAAPAAPRAPLWGGRGPAALAQRHRECVAVEGLPAELPSPPPTPIICLCSSRISLQDSQSRPRRSAR